MMIESYVTIATDDISCLGCLVLCNSLKQTGTEKCISVLVNPIVSCHLKSVLQKSFDKVYCINDLFVISDGQNRFDVHGDYQRLKCWLLTDFSKCVFLESDVLVVENIDDLFDRMELSAISDPRWPDCFDAGVFVFQPCLKTYKNLIDYSISNQTTQNSFQCLLNMFFCDWNTISMERKIPFTYNCQMNNNFYTSTAALVHFGHSIKVARLGNSVFHLMQPDPSTGGLNHDNWSRLWSQWWKIFNETVKPAVDNNDKLNFKRTGVDYGLPETTPEAKTHNAPTHVPEACPESQGSMRTIHELTHCSQDVVIPCHGSACHIQESSCPSQEFVAPYEPAPYVAEPPIQSPEEERDETLCDKLVVSPTAEEDIPVILESADSSEKEVSEQVEKETPENVEKDHRLRWERGEIDYMGADRFVHILAQLKSTLGPATEKDVVENLEE